MKALDKIWSAKKSWLPGVILTVVVLLILVYLAGSGPDGSFKYKAF